MLTFEPYISLALWFPLLLSALAVLASYGYRSRSRIPRGRWVAVLLLMAVSTALPLIVLLNPTWIERLPPPAGKPLLTVLLDRSASMAVADAAAGASRYAEGTQIAARAVRQLEPQFDIRLAAFDEMGVATPLAALGGSQPEGPATDLAAVIEGSLDERPQGQAILLLSDGIHNAGGGAPRVRRSVEKASAMAAPIYTWTLGHAAIVKDLEVALQLPQEMAFAGQSLPVPVSIQQRGFIADRTRLSLVLDGQTVDEKEVDLAADESTEVIFQIRQAKSGLYRYEVRADEHSEEVTALNNAATLLVRVVDEPVRVLLLEGKPYWDTKFLLRTLSRDQSIDLTSIVRIAPGRFLERRISRSEPADEAAADADNSATGAAADAGTTFREEAWEIHAEIDEQIGSAGALDAYQVIVLGRDAEVFLDDRRLAELKKWLAEGSGSLVCVRGPPASQVSQRLGELMPVRWSPSRETRFRVQLTESGRSLRWLPPGSRQDLLGSLPSLATVAQPERPKPLAVVLAAAAGAGDGADPIISYQPIGTGRVVVVEGAGMWRWAFLPAEHQEHDQVYGLLWRSLVRWLVSNVGLLPSQSYSLRSDKVTFSTGERATATLLTHEGQTPGTPQIELTGDTLAEPQTFEPLPAGASPGQFRVVFGELAEGRYQARVVGAAEDDAVASAAFDVRGNLAERLDVAARPDLMRLIAEESGGAVLASSDPAELATEFTRHHAANFPQRVLRISAWDRWWVLLGVLGLWAASWGLRRRSGLV